METSLESCGGEKEMNQRASERGDERRRGEGRSDESLHSPLDLHHLFGDHASDFARAGSRASRDAWERLENSLPSTCYNTKTFV